MTILGNEPANSYENETLVVIGEDRCNLADKNNIDKNIDKNNVHKKESNDLAACPDITGAGSSMVVGLTNLGNTCYMNAVLQLLFCVPSFSVTLTESDKLSKTGIGRELLNLINKARTGNYVRLNTAKLKHEISALFPRYLGYNQHDAHELLIVLLDHLRESLLSDNNQEGISAERDFVMDTSMGNTLASRKEDNSTAMNTMNITPANISHFGNENLNSLSMTPQKGRVHENLPINLIEHRTMDTTLHKNMYQNIPTSKPEKEKFSFIPENKTPETENVGPCSIPIPSTSRTSVVEDECCRSVDSNTAITPGTPDNHDVVWSEWEQHNSSIITDTFYGQFVTHTTCCQCGHTVVNHEPYNHISLPLPHAMDRHVVVTWLPLDTHTAYRYLVTVNQYGTIMTLKSSILALLNSNLTTDDILICEVASDNTIHLTHSEHTQLRHVNDARNSVYVIQSYKYVTDNDAMKINQEVNDVNNFENDLDLDSTDIIGRDVIEANIEVNIDVSDVTKQFKNKLDTFNPEAKIENKPKDTGSMVEWGNCVICLEEFPPHLLHYHHCNMCMCKECYVSYKTSGSGGECPVCKSEIGELKLAGSEHNCAVRWTQTPLSLSHDKNILGHPYLLELPSKIEGGALSCYITTIFPNEIGPTTLYLIDNSGERKEIKDDQEYMILGSNSLVLELASCSPPFQDLMSQLIDTDSLNKLEELRKTLDLQDCLNAFVKSDELCAGSTWYCDVCDTERSAIISTSISHLPAYLILQLNRFNVLSSGRGEKITCPVHIPRYNLDLSCATIGSKTHTSYSLCGIIHHTGGVGGGHYTAQTETEETWRRYNDTSVLPQDPLTSDHDNTNSNDADARSAYVLLYRQNISQ